MLKKLTIGLCLVLLVPIYYVTAGAEEIKKEGEYRGAKTATHPKWFKESFLDLDEDVSDATDANKRLVLYFWQPGCPYCNQLWQDNFAHDDIVTMFRKNFEIVAINMWGDREVISVAGNDFTEKSFSDALGITYTPTLLFFDENKKVVHQLNGYIPPEDFRVSLEYVAGKHEKEETYAAYSLKQRRESTEGNDQLNEEPFFTKGLTNLDRRSDTANDKYLAVFFESANCKNCDLLHEKTLKNPSTRELIRQFQSVQFDRYADTQITTPQGKKMSVKDWANTLGIAYLPATVFFNAEGKEVMRIDAQMRTFHTESVYDYVLSGAYKTEKNFQRYISARSEKLRKQGIDVDIWAY